MNCLIINGSPSKNYLWNNTNTTSFTNKLVESIKFSMNEKNDVNFDQINLIEEDLSFCKGCYSCFNNGEQNCPNYKNVEKIITKIKTADCLILTTPVYAMNISGLLKNFFDLTAYNYHRPSFFEKKALVISSTAGGGAKSNCKYMAETLTHWGFNKVYKLPVVRRGSTELNQKMEKKCNKKAKAFYKNVDSKKLHTPSFKQLFFHQLWRSMSINSACEADMLYWKNTNLISYPYYPSIKLNKAKKIYCGLVFSLLKKTMK